MVATGGQVRPHYRRLTERLDTLHRDRIQQPPGGGGPGVPPPRSHLHGLQRLGGDGTHLPLRPDPSDNSGQRVEAARGGPHPADNGLEPVPARCLPRSEDIEGQDHTGSADPERKALPAGVHEFLGAARHLRAYLRDGPDPRPRRPLPRPGGQSALPLGRFVHDRESRRDAPGVPRPLPELRRSAGRGVCGQSPEGASIHFNQADGQADRRPAHPGRLQQRLLRAHLPRAPDGHPDRRGPGPSGQQRPRLHANDGGARACRCDLQADRR